MTEQKNTLFEEKVPTRSKFAYGGAVFASGILSGLGLGPITYYYNITLGLSGSLVGLAWMIFIVWNSINDPLFGFLEDRTKSKKYGRRIPYIRFGAPFYSILFLFCWFPLVDINNEIALFFNFLIILFAFDTIFTIIGLITYSLPAEMALSSKARAGIMIFSSIFSGLALLITFLLPTLLLTGESSPPVEVFLTTMVIIGIICGIILFISSYFLKENKYTQLEEPLGYWNGLIETFKNKSFLIFEASNFCFTIAQYILTTSVFYYIGFVLRAEGILSMLPLLIFFLVIFVFTVVYNKILGRTELKKVFFLILLMTGLSFIVFFFIGWNFISAILGMVLLGIGFSGYFMTGQLMIADVIDYDEIRTKKRRETSYAGVNALLTKPAVSIAPWLFLTIIAFFGFDNEAATQTPDAQLGIMIGFTIIPAVFILLAAIIIKFFPLSGPKWKEQKMEIQRIHIEKEKAY
ncbi:MAG: MFS transporter, partial [Candidatus Lokiarchaeota archaeon]|nr:MFS transporter [Candidatus Lokiarchaeota archaeon]